MPSSIRGWLSRAKRDLLSATRRLRPQTAPLGRGECLRAALALIADLGVGAVKRLGRGGVWFKLDQIIGCHVGGDGVGVGQQWNYGVGGFAVADAPQRNQGLIAPAGVGVFER